MCYVVIDPMVLYRLPSRREMTKLANHQLPTANRLPASLGVLILLMPLALFSPTPSSPARTVSTDTEGRKLPASVSESPASPTADWWAAVQEDLRRREYHATWQESPLFPGGPAPSTGLTATSTRGGTRGGRAGGYQAPNRAQNLRIGFYPTGIRIVERTTVHPTWTWGLALTGFGRGEPSQNLSEAAPILQANRVEYRRGPITEWYVNDEHGLEQAFQISNPKAQSPKPESQLVLRLVPTGDLSRRLTGDNQAVEFTTADGAPVLRYGSPRATDATGRSLPTRLELAATPHASRFTFHVSRFTLHPLRITINDTTATYPITLRLTISAAHHGSPGGLAASATCREYSQRAWSGTSDQAGALLGWSVSSARDVNGDGYTDVIVGAPRYDHGQTEEGAAFLYTGGPEGLPTSPAWMGESDQEWAWFGYAVATAGDVNNDGYDDVIIGTPRYDGEEMDEGAAFVYHGSSTGLATGPADWTAEGDQASGRLGYAVSTAGDVNGDGYSDVIITANGYDAAETNEGAAFVYLGGPAGLAADPDWTAHPTGQAYANFGRSASTAGDVNRDGYSDVVIGAPWYDNPETDEGDEIYDGAVFVYHGSATGLGSDPDWTFIGDDKHAELGNAVSTAGDVNGDGYSDVIVGAYRYTGDQWREGSAFVYHGSSTGLATDSADWMVEGGQESAKFGLAVSTAGDVDGDGYSDVVVGAPGYADGQAHEGAVFVYHGSSTGLTTGSADWTAEGDQEGAWCGSAVSAAGDVNSDGYSDIIVGAPTYNDGQTDEGAAFVYLGEGEDDLLVRPRQLRSDDHTPIGILGCSDSASQVHLQLTARPSQVITSVALQWQLAPLGTPFTATTAISGTSQAWSDVLTNSVVLSQTIDGLTGSTVYRWRVRLLYPSGNPLGQTGSRWLYLPWNGPQEADFRTPSLLTPDRNIGVFLPLILRGLPPP